MYVRYNRILCRNISYCVVLDLYLCFHCMKFFLIRILCFSRRYSLTCPHIPLFWSRFLSFDLIWTMNLYHVSFGMFFKHGKIATTNILNSRFTLYEWWLLSLIDWNHRTPYTQAHRIHRLSLLFFFSMLDSYSPG